MSEPQADPTGCHFDDDLRSPTAGRRACTGRGNMLACQLCPDALNYWRESYAPAPVVRSSTADPKPVNWGPILTAEQGWGRTGEPKPCSICQKPALMRSPTGVPTHRVCAETRPSATR